MSNNRESLRDAVLVIGGLCFLFQQFLLWVMVWNWSGRIESIEKLIH